nr:glycosyltransferase [Desulforamulus aquiferis]
MVAIKDATPERYTRSWWRLSRKYFEQHLMDSVTGVLSVSAAAYGLLQLKHRMVGTPFVFQAHGTSWGEINSKWKSRSPKAIITSVRNMLWLIKDIWAYSKFDAVVAVGDAVKSDLLKKPVSYVLPYRKIHLISNGINTKLFAPDDNSRYEMRTALGWTNDEQVIVSASRLHIQKGLHLGLNAFAKISQKNPKARYMIIGDGPERKNLERQVSELNISDKVLFTGEVERQNLPPYLRQEIYFYLQQLGLKVYH